MKLYSPCNRVSLASAWVAVPLFPLLRRFIPVEVDPLEEWGATLLNEIAIQMMKAAATICWELEKVGAGITRFLTEQNLWDVFLTSLMNSLRTVMPAILQNLVYGNGGGGLLYLALMLAGIFLIIPQMGSSRLVDAGHAILWALMLVTLFISSATGYDLIQAIEQLRANAISTLTPSAGMALDDLVARPMLADSTDLEDYALVLPDMFEAQYFPTSRDTESAEVLWGVDVVYETAASRDSRRDSAQTGVVLAALTLLPGVTLCLFGIVFATLTAAALVLITFFVVSLPLGFLEFGAHILVGVVRQYIYLWAVTLLAIVLPTILQTAGTLTYPVNGAPTLNDLMRFIPVLVIVTIATGYVSAMATRTLTDTINVVNTSVRSAMAPLAQYTGLPTQGTLTEVGGAIGNVSASTMTALAQGRSFTMAAAAGTGAFIGNLNANAGRAAATVASGVVQSPKANVFAAAARNPAKQGVDGTARVAVAAHRARTGTGSIRSSSRQTAVTEVRPAARDVENLPLANTDTPTHRHATQGHQQKTTSPTGRPTLHTFPPHVVMPTPYALQQASSLMVRQNEPLARADYHRLFGEAGLAEDLVAYHRQAGVRGMNLTQAAVAQTQVLATRRMQAGTPYLNAQCEVLPDIRAAAFAELERSGTEILPEERPLLMRVMARSVHTTTTPGAVLAPLVQNPRTLLGQERDLAAYYALHDVARREGWTPDAIRDVLDTTHYGYQSGIDDAENPTHRAARLLQQLPELRTKQGDERTEIARLAHLVLLDHAQSASLAMPAPTTDTITNPVVPPHVQGAAEAPLTPTATTGDTPS